MACTLASSTLRPALKAAAPTRAQRAQRLVVRASAGNQSVQVWTGAVGGRRKR